MVTRMNHQADDTSRWILSSGRGNPSPGEVDIWRIRLDTEDRSIQHAGDFLGVDELARVARFRLECDRKRFFIAHATVRKILAKYVGCEPIQLVFENSEKGKPRLHQSLNPHDLRFNLSHSNDVALLVVTAGLSVGIDIEAVNYDLAMEEIARAFFSPDEVRSLLTLAKEQRTEAFFCCWTRKEAYIKAKGDGFFTASGSFSVSLRPDRPAALLRVADDVDELTRWSFYDIKIDRAYKATLVVEGRSHKISQWAFSDGTGRTIEPTQGVKRRIWE